MKEEKSDIEQFFSAGLTGGDIPFEESDWKAMEEKLNDFDALAATSRPDWARWIAGTGIAVLLFTAGWFSHQWIIDDQETLNAERLENIAGSNPAVTNPDSGNEDPVTGQSGGTSDHGPGQEAAMASDGQSGSTSDSETSEEAAIASAEILSSDPILREGVARAESNEDRAGSGDNSPAAPTLDEHGNSTPSSGQPEIQGEESGNLTTAPVPVSEEVVRERTGNSRNAEQIPTERSTTDAGLATTRGNHGIVETDLGQIQRLGPEWTFDLPFAFIEGRETEVHPATSPVPAWEIGLTVAPDLNGVGAIENYKLAWEAGVSVYYNVTRHWRLSSGIYYAKKSYLASGTDYSPPEGYWDYHTNGIIPEEVDARCGILDIPLNLTYIWNPRQKFRITTTLGLSNYLILNEDYQYSFGYNKPYSGYDHWSTEENSAAFFGMLNAGIGAEWRIRPGLLMAVEPYVKVPLKEVGFGNVPLTGTGIYFTIRKQISK